MIRAEADLGQHSHLLSLFLSRFGSRCARIFRLVLQKKHLEQKQVEDFAMIPAKEAKDMLYKMLSENFVSLQVTNGVKISSHQGWPRVRKTLTQKNLQNPETSSRSTLETEEMAHKTSKEFEG